MSDNSGGGCAWLFFGGAALGFMLIISKPSGDQVCRTSKLPVLDWMHGVDNQPSCQSLISQAERRAIAAQEKADELSGQVSDLEGRIIAIESRLNM